MPYHHYESFLEFAPDAVVIITEDGTIEYINQAASFLFRYSRDEIVGQSVDVLLPEHLRGVHADYRASYMKHPRRRQMGEGRELIAMKSDGTEFPVDISLAPIESDRGQRYAAAIRDISVQQQAIAMIRSTVTLTQAWMNQLAAALEHLAPRQDT